MCISPKRILNRSLHFDLGKPLFMEVPCGKCEECRKTARNDWFVRCFYQWQNSKMSFFYTCTYNNDNIPRLGNHLCFSKEHCQKFIKRLRGRLEKLGLKLRYMICCEYGEKYGRPHYHVIFFIDGGTIHPFRFYKLVEESWTYGFVKYGDNMGIIDSHRGIQYVTKYITKDIAYMRDEGRKVCSYLFHEYLDRLYLNQRLGEIPVCYNLNVDIDEYRYYVTRIDKEKIKDLEVECKPMYDFLLEVRRAFRDATPFHLQSSKLGIGFLDVATDYEKYSETVHLVTSDGLSIPYKLPRYFKRKFWYDVIENERNGKCDKFVLSEAGKKHLLDTLNDKIAYREKIYNDVLLNPDILDKDALNLINSQPKVGFSCIQDLRFFVRNFDVDVHQMAIYSAVFRDRICPFRFDEIELTPSIVEECYGTYASLCLNWCSSIDIGKVYEQYGNVDRLFEPYMWNHHPYFEPLEYACLMLDALSIGLRSQRTKAEQKKEMLARSLRALLNQ